MIGIKIGNSDYNRLEIEADANSSISSNFLSIIMEYEAIGYTIKFEHNSLFYLGKYKVIAY